ncbi:hypothetical protein ThidrDRAFT_3495 [Thiorhodococcus drewsii AZ1]|uniref:Methyltransferase type 11 n=1 Tax=Thiorhodococcus drewsii AZ1 TaxID=765913 RepID=G2E5D2_9GAMM|nr:class I SAM-dependent methyltransferase [Thiorhodococcus drewsii]EGV28844.1 hypothetical protein ThidrDRAFT_3495 [Thiorhodococcus drewsii AZ1]
MQPNSVLDVGCGLGLYGMLCRVFLDLYDDESYMSKLDQECGGKWKVRVDGIEGTAAYIPYIPSWVYDDVSCGNALDILRKLDDESYDLVLALAILEHFDRDEGIEFLSHLKRIGKKAIISVPKKVMPQEVPGYPYETHRSHWTDTDLAACGFNRFIPHFGAWIAIYDPEITPAAQSVRQATKVRQELNFSGVSSLGHASPNPDFSEMEKALGGIMDSLSAIHAQQEITNNERLSIRFRLRSLLRKLRH